MNQQNELLSDVVICDTWRSAHTQDENCMNPVPAERCSECGQYAQVLFQNCWCFKCYLKWMRQHGQWPSTEYCSCQSIHAAHTWGGQPVRYCPGVLRDEDSNNVCRGHGGDGLPENCRICRPPEPAAPEALQCLYPSLSYQGNGVYTCAECGQHGSESFLEQESARRQSQAGLARAESELAALQAENQRLEIAETNLADYLRKYAHGFDMYRRAWLREIGGVIRAKTHEIDGFVLRTRDLYEKAQRAEKAEAENQRLREALTLIRDNDAERCVWCIAEAALAEKGSK